MLNEFYNKKNGTKIVSLKAKLDARYGVGVCVSENVVIHSDVTIGDYTYVNRNSSIENCVIGNYCSISSGVWICPFEHDLYSKSSHPFVNRNRCNRDKVIIGNDVLISLNAIIISGVKIGNGAVIAAGAVVTHDVRPYEVVGGVPCKHIRWRFNEKQIGIIEESKWWLNDLTTNKFNLSFFVNERDNYISNTNK